MTRAAIRDVAVALPQATLTTADLLADLPPAKAALLARHAGVKTRHIASPGETALDLGERACRILMDRHPDLAACVDILVFCTQTPDHPLPPNSCALHGRLDLPESVMAFDVPHACSAFVYALQLVHALMVAGMGREALIVTADTYTSLIHPDDRAVRMLFGDGGAATWVSRSDDPGTGLIDSRCGTAGAGLSCFVVPAGGARLAATDAIRAAEATDRSGNRRTPAHIHMDGPAILSFVGARLPGEIRSLLTCNDLTLADLDLVVLHQASAVVLDMLTMLLGVPPARVVRTLEPVGNTVSASIPMALRAALDEGRIVPGRLLLLCGFGAGLSWGSALLRW